MKKLITFCLALTSVMMVKANVLPLDWDIIDPSYVYSCSRPINTEYKALKYMKAVCDARYLYIRAGFDTQYIDIYEDVGWDESHIGGVPFHVYLNDNRASNGFEGWLWNTPCFILTEGLLFNNGQPHSAYTPDNFIWEGGEPSNDWLWNEYSNQIVIESIVTDSTVEMQISLATLPFTCNEYIHVGVEIEKEWSYVGILPLGEDNPEIGGSNPGIVDMAKVKISPTPINRELVINHLGYNIDKNTKTASVVFCEQDVTDIEIPNTIEYEGVTYSVTTIGEEAFWKCSGLTSVTIPNSVTAIGNYAFYYCTGLTSIVIGSSVAYIGESAFEYCENLSTVYNNSDLNIYAGSWNYGQVARYANKVYNGILVGDFVIKRDTILTAYIGTAATVTIPNFVTTIGEGAFWKCSGLTSVTIPNSVTTIGDWAFEDCTGLTSVTIPVSVTSIGTGAFVRCESLTELAILNPDVVIASEAFSSCMNLTIITAPASFFDVPDFYWYSYSKQFASVVVNGGELKENALQYINRSYKTLKTLDVSAVTNTEFADEAFEGCYNLESLILPQSLERVGYMMVAGCKNLKSIDIPASVVEIDQSAFEDCRSIKTITFNGNQLKTIGNWAFYNAHQLQNLTLPEGVEEIGEGAFYGCVYLENLVLPRSIKSIGDNGFSLCSKLSKITVHSATPPTIEAKTFYEVNRQIPVYVPSEAVADYKQANYWKEFNIIGVETPTNLESMHGSQSTTHKVLCNGQLLIEANNATYTLMGQKVR